MHRYFAKERSFSSAPIVGSLESKANTPRAKSYAPPPLPRKAGSQYRWRRVVEMRLGRNAHMSAESEWFSCSYFPTDEAHSNEWVSKTSWALPKNGCLVLKSSWHILDLIRKILDPDRLVLRLIGSLDYVIFPCCLPYIGEGNDTTYSDAYISAVL